ncbi:MAG: 4-hydroxy-3-methylbut-2-enyl diphosphate reductase [Marinilabiliales bacterium]|nr:MAG: 4-hydroxy-3-methylbut-2-enyl diphosphate reductase [Marinilabiliales bacterium]
MVVTIDPSSGFCFGVRRAIEQAEDLLDREGKLYCLGDLVHNKAEMQRLERRGLTSIDHSAMEKLREAPLLFRAHGEPPSSYDLTGRNRLSLTDATCPIVKKLQEKVRKAWMEMKEKGGQLVIFGNPGHPETIGLLGHTEGGAVIVQEAGNIEAVNPAQPVTLFSQTTRNPDEYRRLAGNIEAKMKEHFPGGNVPLKVHNTICGQISGRTPRIRKFAASRDVIVFVGGSQSSNAKVLFGQCREVNPRSWFVTGASEIKPEWFEDAGSAGVCGATSTPRWLMEEAAERIRELTAKK